PARRSVRDPGFGYGAPEIVERAGRTLPQVHCSAARGRDLVRPMRLGVRRLSAGGPRAFARYRGIVEGRPLTLERPGAARSTASRCPRSRRARDAGQALSDPARALAE